MRMMLDWLFNTRLNILFEMVILTQVTADYFNDNKLEFIKHLNHAV